MFTDRYKKNLYLDVQENVEFETGMKFMGKPVYCKLIPEFQDQGTGQKTIDLSSYFNVSEIDQCWIDNQHSYVAVGSGTYPNQNYDFRPVNTAGVNTQTNDWGFETYLQKTNSSFKIVYLIGNNVTRGKYYHIYIMYTKY